MAKLLVMREQVERLIAITLLGKNVFHNSQKMSNFLFYFIFFKGILIFPTE